MEIFQVGVAATVNIRGLLWGTHGIKEWVVPYRAQWI
jgi:hypothetical protein